MSRVELGRDRLPRRMDIQSPGSTGLFWRMVGLAGFFFVTTQLWLLYEWLRVVVPLTLESYGTCCFFVGNYQ